MQQDILEMSAGAGPLYAPTPFWAAATATLAGDLAPDRLPQFRALPAPLGFFVPTYGFPANGLSAQQMDAVEALAAEATPKQAARLRSWTGGGSHAEADFRVFAAVAALRAKSLLAFSESQVGAPVEQFEFDGRRYSRSALNYLLGLCFLSEFTEISALRTVLEIGGGFGTLGEILAQTVEGPLCYMDVDIPPTCAFAEYYLEHACPARSLGRVTDALDGDGPLQIPALPDLNVLPNWAIERLNGKIDLFVNFISFQEMEPPVVKNYLDHVARLAPDWILLRNMAEGKQLRSATNPVGVEVPVLSEFYRQNLPDYDCVGSDAQVFGYVTSDGFHSELLAFRRR